MIEKRGAERHSNITRSSVHNQRTCTKVSQYCSCNIIASLIISMSSICVGFYIPRINRSIKEFTNSWNNYPIHTAGHKSAQQLFTAGALLLQNSQIAALDIFHSVDEQYSIDRDGPIPHSEDGSVCFTKHTQIFRKILMTFNHCSNTLIHAVHLIILALTFISRPFSLFPGLPHFDIVATS